MKKILTITILFLAAGCASQEPFVDSTSTEDLLSFSEHITPEFLRKHLEVIAHDSLEGRGTGTPGQKKAADYLAGFYEEIGFTPKGDEGSFFQRFELNAEITDSLVYRTYRVEGTDTLEVQHTVESKTSNGEYIRLFGGSVPLDGSVVFAGFGVNDAERGVQHLEGSPLQGKWVLVFEEVPAIVDGDTLVNPDIAGNNRFGELLGNRDAKGVLLIPGIATEEFREIAALSSEQIEAPGNMSLPYLDQGRPSMGFPKGLAVISPQMAATLLGLEDEAALLDVKESLTEEIRDFEAVETPFWLDYTPYQGIETENVLAVLEGADPELKDEVLVLMAHYDHIGITQPDASGDPINNGADDNGSGTVGLLSIAHALHHAQQQGFRPKRSVLFLHVSAEEVGLLGSRYYSDHPVFPIENTVANFNADMIGRSDPENIERGDTGYVYLIGGEIISSGLDSLVEAGNNRSVQLRLDRRYNDLHDPNQFYRRSDHWNFGRLSVPFVFFFTGVHEDYHRPSDTVDKIDFEKLSRVARLIYASTVKVTNYEGRPEVDNQEFIDITNRMAR